MHRCSVVFWPCSNQPHRMGDQIDSKQDSSPCVKPANSGCTTRESLLSAALCSFPNLTDQVSMYAFFTYAFYNFSVVGHDGKCRMKNEVSSEKLPMGVEEQLVNTEAWASLNMNARHSHSSTGPLQATPLNKKHIQLSICTAHHNPAHICPSAASVRITTSHSTI